MTMKKTNGGALFAARKETKAKAKASSFSPFKQALHPKQQTCVDKDDKKDNNEDDDDDSMVEFFLKVGKHKKFKFL